MTPRARGPGRTRVSSADDGLPSGSRDLFVSHARSHGESFLDLITHRFAPDGLSVLDEPEAALSPQGAMAALVRFHQLTQAGAQFIVATHSPILLAAVPDARILEIGDDGGRHAVDDESVPVALTRGFLADPARSLAALLGDGSGQA